MYWTTSLNEEAADFTMYLNEKRGFFMIQMHHCPSKGRLLTLQADTGVKPYPHYCLHCDHYRDTIERFGLKYIYNFNGMDKAACSELIYDPNVFDGRIIIDEDTEIMDRKTSDNEYFHRAFHGSFNRGVQYLGSVYGEDHVRSYLAEFASTVYAPIAAKASQQGLQPIADMIADSYRKEHASEALTLRLEDNSLEVSVAWCPALRYFKESGISVSTWYGLSTEVVMETLAKNSGFAFTMESYDPETGESKYRFYEMRIK